jgi:hypothetical protein
MGVLLRQIAAPCVGRLPARQFAASAATAPAATAAPLPPICLCPGHQQQAHSRLCACQRQPPHHPAGPARRHHRAHLGPHQAAGGARGTQEQRLRLSVSVASLRCWASMRQGMPASLPARVPVAGLAPHSPACLRHHLALRAPPPILSSFRSAMSWRWTLPPAPPAACWQPPQRSTEWVRRCCGDNTPAGACAGDWGMETGNRSKKRAGRRRSAVAGPEPAIAAGHLCPRLQRACASTTARRRPRARCWWGACTPSGGTGSGGGCTAWIPAAGALRSGRNNFLSLPLRYPFTAAGAVLAAACPTAVSCPLVLCFSLYCICI